MIDIADFAKAIQTFDWLHIALASRSIDTIEEQELVLQKLVFNQFSARGHDLAQVLLGSLLSHQHDGAIGYYRSQVFQRHVIADTIQKRFDGWRYGISVNRRSENHVFINQCALHDRVKVIILLAVVVIVRLNVVILQVNKVHWPVLLQQF